MENAIKIVDTIEEIKVRRAKIGDIIDFRDGMFGVVKIVRDNSVIVDLTMMGD